MSEKPLVGLSVGRWQEMFGDEEALKLAKAAGADAVDLDLLLNDEALYAHHRGCPESGRP